jgi:hypothetical protein
VKVNSCQLNSNFERAQPFRLCRHINSTEQAQDCPYANQLN